MSLKSKHQGGSLKKKFKEYEQPWHVQKFEPVRSWISDAEDDIKNYLENIADQNKELSLITAVLDQVISWANILPISIFAVLARNRSPLIFHMHDRSRPLDFPHDLRLNTPSSPKPLEGANHERKGRPGAPQCSDDLFGLNAAPEDRKTMTRIPAKLFRDFEPGGGLCYILVAAIKYKLARPDFNFEKDLAKADRAAVSAPAAGRPRRRGSRPPPAHAAATRRNPAAPHAQHDPPFPTTCA